MRYVGSKAKLIKRIAPLITAIDGQVYCEPFCGGLNSFSKIAPRYSFSLAVDSHPDLIAMWTAIWNGWTPPTELSATEYAALKNAPPSPLRGFAGFGCSFGGKWFGGLAKGGVNAGGVPRNHVAESSRAAVARIAELASSNVSFARADYREITPGPGWVVYCDPPYRATLGYGSEFDSDQFWSVVGAWHEKGATVFVSEYSAPPDWRCIAEFPHRMSVALAGDRRETTERLFTKWSTKLSS